MSLQIQSGPSCTTCRSRKRRCDKRLPKCSLCTKKNLHCLYTPQLDSRRRYNPALIQQQNVFHRQSAGTTPKTLSPATPTYKHGPKAKQENSYRSIDFPSVFFLDSKIFQQYHIKIPKAKLSIPGYVRLIINDTARHHEIAKLFFETVHHWMPIISKKHFYEHINPFSMLRSDYALLILAMDLITWLPGSQIQDAHTSTYLAAKRYYQDLEYDGLLSIQALQAGILIAIFEIGHAIYPSAFLTVAACARYGSALGLDWRIVSQYKVSSCWIDEEEQNRVWWAIVLLDRIINIGQPERPLLIPDPELTVLLPGTDTGWDRGTLILRARYSVATPTIEWGDMGPFALVAQATRLLGMVLRHISNPLSLDEEEGSLLDRTLRSLSHVVAVEGQLQDLHIMNQQAICGLGLILLHEAHASLHTKTKISMFFAANHYSTACTSQVSQSMALRPKHSDQRSVLTCVEEASPFVVPLLYQSSVVNERLHVEAPTEESLENVTVIKEVLAKFDTRWKSSGEYLKILEAREMQHKKL